MKQTTTISLVILDKTICLTSFKTTHSPNVELQTNPPQGIQLEKFEDDLTWYVCRRDIPIFSFSLYHAYSKFSTISVNSWVLRVDGAPGTLYAGEVFHLQFRFEQNYPLESPEVIFLNPVPVHPHVCIFL